MRLFFASTFNCFASASLSDLAQIIKFIVLSSGGLILFLAANSQP